MRVTTREMQYANRFNTKTKRSRNDWKSKRHDRRQWIFDGKAKETFWEWGEVFSCYIPLAEYPNKRETDFMRYSLESEDC